jgi:amidohydrolase
MKPVLSLARDIFPYTRNLRREFHRYPELGFQEFKTSEIIQRELSRLDDFLIHNKIGETGITAVIKGEKPGKTLLLRFDMDALPVRESTGLDFASRNEGIMHACGHDGHLAIGLSVARILAETRQELSGQVKFLFQPAEEGLGGAQRVIAEGILKDPEPELALALHLWNEKPLGWLGISDGPVMSASDTFQITILGRGGHGGKPHEAVDPILASAGVINALQALVSREVPPLESAVVTVCTIRAGEAHNVIPDQAVLSGTIRSFRPETRQQLLGRFQEIVKGVAAARRCRAEISLIEISPPVVNEPYLAEIIRQTARELFPEGELDQNYQTMASEDMAFIMEQVPGCYCFIGSANLAEGLNAKHHQPDFNFDERALIHGTALLVGAVHKLLAG